MKIKLAVIAVALLVSSVANAVPWSLTVVDENGKPVQAQVRISRWFGAEAQQLKTDVAGHAAGDAEPNANGDLGNVLIFADGHATAGGTLQPGENRAKMGAARTLAGRVLDDAGKPLAGVAVQLASIWGGDQGGAKPTLENFVNFTVSPQERALFTVRTDAEGRYSLQNLPGRGTANIALNDPLWQRVAVNVDLLAGGDVPDLKTRPAARLSGRVLGTDGKPLAGKFIQAVSSTTFASTETHAEGRYVLGGLAAGKAAIVMRETPENASGVQPDVEATGVIGTETAVPDIRLSPGATVEIKSVPAVSGGRFMLRPEVATHYQGLTVQSLKDGAIRVRVRPGVYRLMIFQPPQGFVTQPDWATEGITIDAVEGQTKTTEIHLDPALALKGIARDETGKPVAGIKIQGVGGDAATTDAEGRFTITGFKPGTVWLSMPPDWDIVKPEKIILPATQPIVVTLAKVALAPLRGRVVDDKGAPIENATVTVNSQGTKSGVFMPYDTKTMNTGADGRYEIKGLRGDAQITIKAAKPKHRLVSGGVVTSQRTIMGINGAPIPNPKPAFTVSDIVLQPVEREAAGRVVDAAGMPVANAVVAALFGGQEEYGAATNITRTDAEGRFKLSELPAGELAFVAGAGDGFAEIKSKPEALGDLVLQPQKRLVRDIPLARQIVLSLIEDARDERGWPRAWLPLILAPYDFESAREIAGAVQLDGKPRPDVLREIVSHQIRNDPQAARATLTGLLPEADTDDRWFATFVMRVLSLVPQPEQATVAGEDANTATLRAWVRRVFVQWRDKLAGVNVENLADRETGIKFARLAVLGARLGEADTEKWAKSAIQIGARFDAAKPDGGYGIATIIQTLAEGGAALTEKALDSAPPEQRLMALNSAIPIVARSDIEGARRLLELMSLLPNTQNSNMDWFLGSSLKAVISRMEARDAAAALALARRARFPERALALAQAARLQPKAEAVALFREAFEMAVGNGGERVTPGIIAGLALGVDTALGNELLAKTEDEFFKTRSTGAFSVPTFYLAQTQPGRARAWIEWKWARAQGAANGPNGPWELVQIAIAMSALDTKRALEMAAAIPPQVSQDGVEDLSERQSAYTQIAAFLAAPEKLRNRLDLSQYWGSADAWTSGDVYDDF